MARLVVAMTFVSMLFGLACGASAGSPGPATQSTAPTPGAASPGTSATPGYEGY